MKAFYTTLIISIMLIVGGFFVPPLGIIDGSVLTAVGLLLMFAVLAQVPGILQAVRDGERIKLSKGDFSAEVSRTSYDNDNDALRYDNPSTCSGKVPNDKSFQRE